MRKRDLLLGLALCGLTSVFAQKPIFLYDFDQDGQDSLNGNGHLVYGTDTIWDNISSVQEIKWRNPEAQRDCTILIYKAVYSDFTKDGAEKQDSWEIIPEEGNEENNVFHLTTGDATGAADYQRVLRLYFPDSLIQDNSSYRISYRVKANAEAQSELFIVRGIDYNDVRWQYWNGKGKGDQTVSISDFNPEQWTNASGVFFYLSDSLMEATAKERAGWWSGSWGDADGIYQPDINRMQAWFKTENSEYYVDDIKLFKSYIGGAESNQDVIRVNFGYQTNGAALAAATPFGAIDLLELDPNCVSITGVYEGEEEPVAVRWAEFHTDGYLYIWADLDEGQDLTADYFDEVYLSFKNLNKDFVYNGNTYPNALDETFDKVVLGFEKELVIPSERAFGVVSITQQPPTFVSVDPENGSFNLSVEEDKVFKFLFSKPVYLGEDGACIRITGGDQGEEGKELILTQDPENENGVIATLPASIKSLNGDYTFIISDIMVEAGAQASTPVELTYTFGDATGQAMVEYLNSDWWLKLGANTLPAGWQFGDVRIGDSYIDGDGNAQNVTTYGSGIRLLDNGSSATYKLTIYFCNRDGAKSMIYGKQDGYKLHLPAGSYYLNVPLGVHDGSGADGANPMVTVYGLEDPSNIVLASTSAQIGGDRQSAVAFAQNKYQFTVATEADYVIEISCECGTPKGLALAPVSVTNVYSSAYGYVKSLNDQLAINKQLVDDNAELYGNNPLYKSFAANYLEASTWSAKQPKQYEAKVEELKAQETAFRALLTSVADFQAALKNANNVIENNQEGPLASSDAFETLKSVAAQYADHNAYEALTDVNNAAKNDLNNSAAAFNVLVAAMEFYQIQPKALKVIADSLGFDWSSLPEGADVDEKIAAQTGNNVDFINVLKTAVKWGIYKKFANNDVSWMPTIEVEDTLGNVSYVPELDMSDALIANSRLYTTFKGSDRKDQQNYYMPVSIGSTELFPLWTITKMEADNMCGQPWDNLCASDAQPLRDSNLGGGMNNHLIALEQTVTNIPAGKYSIGAGMSGDGARGEKILGHVYVAPVAGDTTYTVELSHAGGDWYVNPDQADRTQGINMGQMDITSDFVLTIQKDGTGWTWSRLGDPKMRLNGLAEGFDYVTAEAAMADQFKQAVETAVEEIFADGNSSVAGLDGKVYQSVEEVPAGTYYISNAETFLK